MAEGAPASVTATVMFTDLVASTELMARLGDAAFDDLRRAHFADLHAVVAVHGGVDVKNTGDGLLVTFDSAAAALAAAVAAQQACARPDPARPVPIELRVGLALGEVAHEAGDVFGTPVVEAARLVARAEPGQILTTSVVPLVAGSRAGVTCTDLGTVELKGLPHPVPICSVAWAPAEATALPLPTLFSGAGRIFVGRDDLLGRLLHLRKETVGGGRRVALVAGEPGIGKTRLATALAEAVHTEGAVVLAGRCDEDLGVPFQPFVEALQHYTAHAAELRLGRYGGELARLVPELSETIPGLAPPLRSDPETERYRLFDAVAAWLADVSAEAPVLLVIDDLHWAARPTLLLLRHVLRSAEPVRLLVVVTYRDSEVGRGHPLSDFLADLRRLDGVERFPLAGLDRAAVSAFIEAAAGHRLTEDEQVLPVAVWTETEGNPFFVAEVLRHLTETGGVERGGDGRWTMTAPVDQLGIPEGVREVVGQRLTRLTEVANRALAVGAVTGLEFEPAVVRVAADLANEELIGALEESAGARLVSEVGGGAVRYRFAHALVRATLYDELSGPRRAAVHGRVADAIEAVHGRALDDHLPALAHHTARAAAPGEPVMAARAVDYATRAGDRALAQLANDEAATYYGQALALLEGCGDEGADLDRRRVDLLIALGEAQRRGGDQAYRATLLDAGHRAHRLGLPEALARAALANSRPGYNSLAGSVDAERVAMMETALDAITSDFPDEATAAGSAARALRARLLAALATELVYGQRHRDRRIALTEEALALARAIDDKTTLFHVLVARFLAINSPRTVPERLADTAELLALAETLDDPQTRFLANLQRARVTLETGDLATSRLHLGEAHATAVELGQPVLRWLLHWARFGEAQFSGRLDEAARLADEAVEVGTAAGQPDVDVIHTIQRFVLAFERGGMDELEPDLVAVAERGDEVPGVVALQGLLHCEGGRPELAREVMAPIAERGYALPDDIVCLYFTHITAEVVHQLDDRVGAAALLERLAPFAALFSVTAGMSMGCTAHYVGLLQTTVGRLDEAVSSFSDAASAHERVGAPAYLGRTQVAWARALLARRAPGDVDQARSLVSAALAVGRERGLVTVERRAAALLDAV